MPKSKPNAVIARIAISMSALPHCWLTARLKYGDKGEISHLPLEAADPDMHHLANVLRDCKKDCTFICESPLQERDAVVFRDMF